MVLITVARRVHDQRTLTRTLLTVVAVAVAVICGLLAMHSMNTHAMTSGHGDTVAVGHSDLAAASTGHTAGTDHAGTHLSQSAPGSAAADAGCATCSDDHGMAWMACVLALLVAVILLARPAGWWRQLIHALAQPTTPARTHGALHFFKPPSLTVLCISRT